MKEAKLYARPFNGGMSIYVKKDGRERFVMTHRKSNQLFFYLNTGRSLGEVRGFRPGPSRGGKKMGHSLEYIVRVADYVLREAA